ncbi:MAG: hypothetical protein JRI23_01245 [Deltaproteobacteria bacterium]|jgi:hypothetical protein|nr:hypothetical protein [Deltaproteobacteria bacterium]MBW2530080.1 hypothetical protein [Deltaproteobacteria bacterium]
MRTVRWLGLVGSLLAAGWISGCSADPGDPSGSSELGSRIVPPGKADNFISASAQEYVLEGTTTVTIEEELRDASEEDKLARVHELIGLKQVVVGWFLNQYVTEKKSDDPNADYGGFNSLTKHDSYEQLGIEAVDELTYEFTFQLQVGGQKNLMTDLEATLEDDGRRYFDLIIGKISNTEMAELETNNEWYRQSPWSKFNPETVDAARLETLRLAIWPEESSKDGWFEVERLFEDGKVTIDVHFGWDYHNDYHLVHSRSVYGWLTGSQGFESPVESYDDLTRTSGPLTKTIDVDGQPVLVEISLFWGKPDTETDPDTDEGGKVLEEDMRASFRDREVIMFSGHSGPFYGFALANWRKTEEGDLDDSEISSLEMPAGVYQLVIAEGCDTYGLGQAFRLNPAKPDGKDVDVVTTTSYSNASTANSIKDSIEAIVGQSYDGTHEPPTFKEYLREMDNNSWFFQSMYGVHGIDDNPHGHPFGRQERLCQTCQEDADCGGVGNECTELNEGEKVCSYQCTADDGCPEGYACMEVAEGSYLQTRRLCAPTQLSCPQ